MSTVNLENKLAREMIADINDGDDNYEKAISSLEELILLAEENTLTNNTQRLMTVAVKDALEIAEYPTTILLADSITRSLAKTTNVTAWNLSQIIHADIHNGDEQFVYGFNSAYTAISLLNKADAVNADSYADAISNITESIEDVLEQSTGIASTRFAEYATYAVISTGVARANDLVEIISADINDGAAYSRSVLSSAWVALNHFEDSYAANSNLYAKAVSHLTEAVEDALTVNEYPQLETLGLAQSMMITAENTGLLRALDVADVISADIGNGDDNYNIATLALRGLPDALAKDTHVYATAVSRVTESIEDALEIGSSGSLRFALNATHLVADTGVMRAMDIAEILASDVNNGDDDFGTASTALKNFESAGENAIHIGVYETAASSIMNSITNALELNSFNSTHFAKNAMSTIADSSAPLRAMDLAKIIASDVHFGSISTFNNLEIGTAKIALDHFVDSYAAYDTIYAKAASIVTEAIEDALEIGTAKLIDFARNATSTIMDTGVAKALDIADIIEADVMNGDYSFESALIALNAFDNSVGTESQLEASAESIVQSAIKAQEKGIAGLAFADTVADVLGDFTDTSQLI